MELWDGGGVELSGRDCRGVNEKAKWHRVVWVTSRLFCVFVSSSVLLHFNYYSLLTLLFNCSFLFFFLLFFFYDLFHPYYSFPLFFNEKIFFNLFYF